MMTRAVEVLHQILLKLWCMRGCRISSTHYRMWLRQCRFQQPWWWLTVFTSNVDGVGGMEDQHHGQEDLVWNVWCGIDIDLNGGCCMLP